MRMNRPQFYKLIGRLPVPVANMLDWGRWRETGDRRVAQDNIGPMFVSTIFLGLDHQFSPDPQAPPILFETMIFGADEYDSYLNRYSTWDEAEKGHAEAVEHARQLLAKADAMLAKAQC
jgi:hypothetical protein